MITGIVMTILGVIGAGIGLVFVFTGMMEKAGAWIITVVNVLILLVGCGLIGWGYHQEQQQQAIRRQEAIMRAKKQKAQQELDKKKQAENKLKKLERADQTNNNKVEMRQLNEKEYALPANVIYKLYNNDGQSFFDTQYPSANDKEYALKHIGLTLPGLHIKMLNGQTATVDNVPTDKRKIVLVNLKINLQGHDQTVLTNTDDIGNDIQQIESLSKNYPDVNFIICFPYNTRKTWNAFLQQSDPDAVQNIKGYNLIALGPDNPDVGGNYGSLHDLFSKSLEMNSTYGAIFLDQHDRIAMTIRDAKNSSEDVGTMFTRFTNLAFTSNDAQKVYNMLKPEAEIEAIVAGDNRNLNESNSKTLHAKGQSTDDGDD